MEKAKRVDVGFWGSLIMANFTENIYLSIIWLVLAFYYLINSFKVSDSFFASSILFSIPS